MILVRLLAQTVLLALGQIWANKVRSLLTTLGIIIGVASITAVIAALNGLQGAILSEFETFGTNKVFIDGRVPRSKWGTMSWTSVQLKERELNGIVEKSDAIVSITPMFMSSYDVRVGNVTRQGVSVTGIWPTWHKIENRSVTLGRPFSSVDEENVTRVCLINDKAIEELSLEKDPVNDFIEIDGERFCVVGVVETRDAGMFGAGENRSEIFIPLSTAQAMRPDGWINYAVAEMGNPKQAEDAMAEVTFILRKMRNLAPEDENTFEVQVLQQFIDQFNNVARMITAGASGIVGISLLVGGIGIMNIMLVSVSERTREIGLRKAMGARPVVVLLQFLVEAVVLCLFGAAIGLAVSQGFVLLLKAIPNAGMDRAAVPLWAVALSVGFSAATGVIFGMFPAIKAARLDPIVALRHE